MSTDVPDDAEKSKAGKRDKKSPRTQTDDEVVKSYDDGIEVGAERLKRSMRVLAATGFIGGVEISLGVLAYLFTLHETDSHLLAGLAFSIGFISLYLAHSELFTEGFFYPVVAVFDDRGTFLDLFRLWTVTFITNLLGGWTVMWMVVKAYPTLSGTINETAHHFIDTPLGVRSVCLALLGGAAITLMTRMQSGADSNGPAIVAAVAGAYLLAGTSMFHSVLDSMIILGAIHEGGTGIGYLDWLSWVWYVAILNLLGGFLLISLPRVVRVSRIK